MAIKLFPDLPTQKRIADATESIASKIGGQAKSKVYGVSGLGQENPVLTRTYDAVGVNLVVTPNANDSDLLECVATDNEFQEFFNFPEYTDIHGNVFVTITPKAFRIDSTSGGEIKAISVKEYETGDEALGFVLHPAFKKWMTQTEFDGFGSIAIAKYINAAYDVVNDEVFSGDVNVGNLDDLVVTSKPGLDYAQSFAPWDEGREVIKNTDGNYNMLTVLYESLIQWLQVIYFGRLDIINLFGVQFTENAPGEIDPKDLITETGTTDNIVSHTGFNKNSYQFKIFNLDGALVGQYIDGVYSDGTDLYYSRIFDFDGKNDNGALKSTMPYIQNYNGDFDLITKLGYDENEPFFHSPLALRPTTPEHPENSVQNLFYSVVYGGAEISSGFRGQKWGFGKGVNVLYPDDGIFKTRFNDGFGGAWDDDDDYGALRLCKPPF